VGLVDARKQCDAARKLLAQGIDPSAVKREQRARASAERLTKKNESAVQLRVGLDGTVEIWKGRALVKLKSAEACAVRDLLIKLTA
jgi:type II secretory pathway component PulF